MSERHRPMTEKEQIMLNRIDQLLEKEYSFMSDTHAGEVYVTVTNMFEKIYGPHSPQLKLLETIRDQVYEGQTRNHNKYESDRMQVFTKRLYGCLRALKSDIEEGLIVNIRSEARGEVFGDFLVLAREALDADQKDVAAVLACAALEDALKRGASDRGLEVHDKDMSEVVNALKSAGVIRGPQGALLRGFVQIRNKTFHAQWTAINSADVSSIIAFTEKFLVKQFSSPIATDPAYS